MVKFSNGICKKPEKVPLVAFRLPALSMVNFALDGEEPPAQRIVVPLPSVEGGIKPPYIVPPPSCIFTALAPKFCTYAYEEKNTFVATKSCNGVSCQ